MFVDLYAQRYYVLVPVSAGRRYEWAVRRDPEGVRSCWCVPMDGPGALAVPDAVSQLLAVARFRRAKAESEADE